MPTTNQLLLLLALLVSSSALVAPAFTPPHQYDCSGVIYSGSCNAVTCYTDCQKKYTQAEGLCVPQGCKCSFYCPPSASKAQPN